MVEVGFALVVGFVFGAIFGSSLMMGGYRKAVQNGFIEVDDQIYSVSKLGQNQAQS